MSHAWKTRMPNLSFVLASINVPPTNVQNRKIGQTSTNQHHGAHQHHYAAQSKGNMSGQMFGPPPPQYPPPPTY